MQTTSYLEPITLPHLAADGLRHGFFTRQGGVSTGLYASLNCGPGSADDATAVQTNRARVAGHMGAAGRLATLYQVHGRDVVVIDEAYDFAARPKADGLVTKRRGVALGILAADCAPVLFADAKAGVIGACHAGWRGALYGAADATIAAMEQLGAARSRIKAAIGPCIRQASYEVSDPFRDTFLKQEPANAAWFGAGQRPGHWQFDLPGYLLQRLRGLHVDAVDCGLDTRSDAERFYSYRRMTLAGEADYGRQIAAIALSD
ncbi:peptidoglycan editing factor PgeF [Ferrovibrio sp.]|uniref:peptidoglycan editing factor PgeF n=1 Tax=Ferrovibrio sp. TaxID=1917215 RepID=UPI0025BED18B|nr:peptidoglycan editing factor PgeF [Ferrovibrio sp.]MBX3455096.1 peptidoglycan editing factor PgeF [Ferrovibrio sp.]